MGEREVLIFFMKYQDIKRAGGTNYGNCLVLGRKFFFFLGRGLSPTPLQLLSEQRGI